MYSVYAGLNKHRLLREDLAVYSTTSVAQEITKATPFSLPRRQFDAAYIRLECFFLGPHA